MSQEQTTLPRDGSIMFNFVKGTEEKGKATRKKFTFWNKWLVKPLYRINILPLLGMGRIFVLVTHFGRKSGAKYMTPLEFRQIKASVDEPLGKFDGQYVLFASGGNRSNWYRNMKAKPDEVVIKQGFRTMKPELEFVEDITIKLEIMKWYCLNYPMAARSLFGYNKKEDVISDELVRPVAEFIQIIVYNY